ncbi:nitrite reductase (NADH) small subunit [Geodermatophilus dictyosporus]|uniref:Nitrite reductase (NADH) small subunit n=1 Tax=Geodermatophilus dictyosporus TaxID=1523247 RepID=A0A1I5Q536_9ACTN|nr:Rieske (2Fe-2S) protein [Geodermatophilus dictyosporus]SFP41110.1 nitrite reductase (NADH) small subunit [Geodermatophilus dictyosporus]
MSTVDTRTADTGTVDTGTADTRPAAPAGVRAHAVARVEDVPPGEGRAFVAGGVQVAVFRLRDGSLHATQAACPHAGGPLADGQTDPDVLVCPLHLYGFRWTDGSSTGGVPPLTRYPVRELDGMVVVET